MLNPDIAAQLWKTRHDWTIRTRYLAIEFTLDDRGYVIDSNKYTLRYLKILFLFRKSTDDSMVK